MRHLRQAGAVLGLMFAVASTADAQARGSSGARPLELGFDAALSFVMEDPGLTALSIPAAGGLFGAVTGTGGVRMGFFTSDKLSIEPFLGLNYVDPEGGDALSLMQLGVGGLWHFQTSRTARQFYARPFLTLVRVASGGDSDSELGFGIGGGIKFPRLGGRMAIRTEANIFAIEETTSLNFLAGLSFYTR